MPHPGPLTLYSVAEPDELGEHRYGGWQAPLIERSRGQIYTQRAGLLDLAHIRMTIDWNWYYSHRILATLDAGDARAASDQWLELGTSKATRIYVQFTLPEQWAELPADQQHTLHQTLALRTGQKLAWYGGIWHELLQWTGYQAVPGFSESDSAFTHDDTTAHLVGLHLAEAAWDVRHERSFDQAITQLLQKELEQLGAVSAERTHDKVLRMRGRWWDSSGVKRRHLDHWSEYGHIRPWLVADAPGEPGRFGEPMPLPDWNQVEGVAIRDMVRIRFAPNIRAGADLADQAGIKHEHLCPWRDFPKLKSMVLEQMVDEHGPQVTEP